MSDLEAGFRAAMRRYPAGTTIFTAVDEVGRPYAMTATAFTSVTLVPPTIVACVNGSASLARALAPGRAFAVSVLCRDQATLAEACAGKVDNDDRFSLDAWIYAGALPLVRDALAAFVTRIRTIEAVGTHFVVLAEVEDVRVRDEGEPLVYADGRFGTLAPRAPDEASFAAPPRSWLFGRKKPPA